MIYVYNSNTAFRRQIEYTFSSVLDALRMDYEYIRIDMAGKLRDTDILIAYADEKDALLLLNRSHNTILIKPCDKLFGENYLRKGSIPEKVRRHNGAVSIYGGDREPYIEREFGRRKVIRTDMDLVSDIFFMLSRYEEVVNGDAAKKERFSRFPADSSVAFKNDFLRRPVADEHMDLLWDFIDGFNLGYRKSGWWRDKSFAACLTHDVDDVIKFKRFSDALRPGARLLTRGKPAAAFKSIFSYFTGYDRDPYYTFDYIMDLEKHYGFGSSFYFMSGGTSAHDSCYDPNEARIKKLMARIESEGFEAGYHGSFNSYDDGNLLIGEKEKLDSLIAKKPYGCRQHFLRFSAPYTWKCQERAGLMYDATLGFADQVGFRCGTCFPFKPYDLFENRVLNIWEIPLTVMDGTLQNKAYMGYLPDEGLDASKRLIDTVIKHGGVFTLLYHNSSFDYTEPAWDGWRWTFQQTIKYLYENNCFGTSGREIINIIRQRKS